MAPPSGSAEPAVARRPLETPAQSPSPTAPGAAASIKASPAKASVPAGTQYVCVTHANGTRQQTAIEFAPNVAALCRRHPEMGPCQYERDRCRAIGGRVFAADGAEITRATEADYDKKVMRARFRSN